LLFTLYIIDVTDIFVGDNVSNQAQKMTRQLYADDLRLYTIIINYNKMLSYRRETAQQGAL